MIPAYYMANKHGIARIASTGISVGTSKITVSFARHNYLTSPYQGLVLIKLTTGIPASTTQTLPVIFTSGTADSTIEPVKLGDQPITAADMPGQGIYLFYYDSVENKLQQLSGTI